MISTIADITIATIATASILGCFALWLRLEIADQRNANLEAHNEWLREQVEAAHRLAQSCNATAKTAQRHAAELLASSAVAFADNDALRRRYAHLGVRQWRKRQRGRYPRLVWVVRREGA